MGREEATWLALSASTRNGKRSGFSPVGTQECVSYDTPQLKRVLRTKPRSPEGCRKISSPGRVGQVDDRRVVQVGVDRRVEEVETQCIQVEQRLGRRRAVSLDKMTAYFSLSGSLAHALDRFQEPIILQSTNTSSEYVGSSIGEA